LQSETKELHRVPISHESLQEFVLDMAEKSVHGVQQSTVSRIALLYDWHSAGFLKWGLGISECFEICPTIKGDIVFKFNMGHLEQKCKQDKL